MTYSETREVTKSHVKCNQTVLEYIRKDILKARKDKRVIK